MYEATRTSGQSARAKPRSRGFTLIELVVTLVIMGILASIGSSVIANTFTTVHLVNRNQDTLSQARYAMERMAREIREIDYTGSAYLTTNMAATNFVFTKSDGTIVTLNNAGTNLTISYSTLSGVVATLTNKVDTSGFTLNYYDVGNGAATASTLRFVRITLTIRDPATGYTNTLRSRVAVRNA
jgi:prepilin-type N-terminal cleavage/methylation domain-containing protein